MSPHSKWCQLPLASSLESILAKKCACTEGRTLRYTKYSLKTRQSKIIGQRKCKRNSPQKWFKLRRGHNFFCEPVRMSIHKYWTLFHPNKCIMYLTLSCLYVKIHFYTDDRPGLCHLSLATVPDGLLARIQHSPGCCPTCLWLETKILFKLLQVRPHEISHAWLCFCINFPCVPVC